VLRERGDKDEPSIEKARAKGLSVRAIAAKVGVGVGTVYRVIKGQHVSQA
jgi:transposase